MGIIDSEWESSTRTEVLQWVLDNFPHYRGLALGYMLRNFGSNHVFRLDEALHSVDASFLRAFEDYQLDLKFYPESDSYYLNVESAQIVLARWLEPERKGTFRFLDLPAELRNRIYEMTATFAGRVIETSDLRRPREATLFVSEEDFGKDQLGKDQPFVHVSGCLSASPSKTLNLAVTCKQLAKELIPIFYGGNVFNFPTSLSIETLVARTKTERLRHLKHVRIPVSATIGVCILHDSELQSVLDRVSAVASLDTLVVTISEHTSPELQDQCDPTCMHSSVETWSSIPSLCAVARLASKAKKVEIVGSYVEDVLGGCSIKSFIVEEAARLKSQQAQDVSETEGETEAQVIKEVPREQEFQGARAGEAEASQKGQAEKGTQTDAPIERALDVQIMEAVRSLDRKHVALYGAQNQSLPPM